MRGVLNQTGFNAVDHWGHGGVTKEKDPNKAPDIYYHTMNAITLTVNRFCREIDINIAFSRPRTQNGITFPACKFNLVSAKTGLVLAYIFPVAAGDIPSRSITVGTRGVHKVQQAIQSGEPTLLMRDSESFGVLCPNDPYIFKRILSLMKISTKDMKLE